MRSEFVPSENINSKEGTEICAKVGPWIHFSAELGLDLHCPGDNTIQPVGKQANGDKKTNEVFFSCYYPIDDQRKNKDPVKCKNIWYGPECFSQRVMCNIMSIFSG